MKKALTVLIVLLLLVGGAAWYFVTYRMDAMIEKQIETGGLISFGTRVSVGDVSTSIKDGTLTISEVTVANPRVSKMPMLSASTELKRRLTTRISRSGG